MHRSRWTLAVVAFLLLAAACGQKTGVAGSIAAGGGGGGGGSGAFDDSGFGGEGFADDGLGGEVAPGDAGGSAGGGGGGVATGGGTSRAGGGGGTAPGAAGGGSAPAAKADRTGISANEIRIGIHAPITGAAAVETFSKGAGVYSHFAGKLPKVGNRSMKILTRDDKFNPSDARQACIDLVQKEKVFVLIGGAGADQIQTCAQYAESVGVPYLSPGVTEGGFANLNGYFALSETYNQQNVQLGQLIKKQLGNKPVGIVLTDSPLLKETEDDIKAQGLNIVATEKLAKDAGQSQTDTAAQQLKSKGAEIVYALISPLVFINLVGGATRQQYFPVWVGPGLSNGLNLVAKGVCSQNPQADVRYLSPMVQMDIINQQDPDYIPAYRNKPGNGPGDQPDDIGILLWGIEKTLRLMLDEAGPDVSRQSFVQTLTSGKVFATNVYAPVKFGGKPHFGASQTTLLKLNCGRAEFDTQAKFVSGF